MSVYQRVAIIGVGLIGGSIGLALKRRGLAAEVIGVGRRAASLAKATERGAVDDQTTNFVQGLRGADFVVVATPVGAIVDAVQSAALAAPKAVLTDAGSTKAEICRALIYGESIDQSPPQRLTQFVGSHPLAGGHQTGPEHARDDLLEGRTVAVTPDDDSLPAVVERVSEFWSQLGAEVVLISPEDHDRALATTSHLPHLVAAALAASTPEEWLQLAASGWADTTRIGAADPGLWLQIFRQNRSGILDALRQFERQLAELGEALESGNDEQLVLMLHDAKRIRDALGD